MIIVIFVLLITTITNLIYLIKELKEIKNIKEEEEFLKKKEKTLQITYKIEGLKELKKEKKNLIILYIIINLIYIIMWFNIITTENTYNYIIKEIITDIQDIKNLFK
jgi:uncharacterized ion transporter superfamily protein YfcC